MQLHCLCMHYSSVDLLNWVVTVVLEHFVEVCVLLGYLSAVLYMGSVILADVLIK